jgi:hypothetical protein
MARGADSCVVGAPVNYDTVSQQKLFRRELVAALAIMTACSAPAPAPSGLVADDETVHVHGLGVNPADGRLYVASHLGLLRVGDGGRLERRGERLPDLMGFTVLGPDTFLASGHPDLRDLKDLSPYLGLVESVDGGRKWQPRSLKGLVDFHALAVGGQNRSVFGLDTRSGRLLLRLIASDGSSADRSTASRWRYIRTTRYSC